MTRQREQGLGRAAIRRLTVLPCLRAQSGTGDGFGEAGYVDLQDLGEEVVVDDNAPPPDDDDLADVMDEDDDVVEVGDEDGGALGNIAEEDDGAGQAAIAEGPDMADVTFSGHSDSVYCAAVNPAQPTQFATGGGDDRGFLWTLASDGQVQSVHELKGHSDTVSCVGFSSDGTLLATGGFDGKVLVWRADTGEKVTTLEGPEDVEWLTWHSKGNSLLAGSGDGTVWLWLAATGACMQVFAGHEARVSCGSFSSNGRAVVTGSDDGTVRLWAPKTGECKHVFRGHGFCEGPVTCLAGHPDPEQAALFLAGSEDGTARLIHLQTKKVLATLVHSSPTKVEGAAQASSGGGDDDERPQEHEQVFSVESVGFSATHPWVATASLDGKLKIWDVSSGVVCRQTCTHPSGVTKLSWHPRMPVVLTGCADGAVRAWDARTGAMLLQLTGHQDMVLDLAIFFGKPEEQPPGAPNQLPPWWVLSVSDDNKARVFVSALQSLGEKFAQAGGSVLPQVPAAGPAAATPPQPPNAS